MAEKKMTIADLSDDCFVTHMEWKRGVTNYDSECVVKIARSVRTISPQPFLEKTPFLEVTLRSNLSLLDFFPNNMSRKVKLRIELVTEEAKDENH